MDYSHLRYSRQVVSSIRVCLVGAVVDQQYLKWSFQFLFNQFFH